MTAIHRVDIEFQRRSLIVPFTDEAQAQALFEQLSAALSGSQHHWISFQDGTGNPHLIDLRCVVGLTLLDMERSKGMCAMLVAFDREIDEIAEAGKKGGTDGQG